MQTQRDRLSNMMDGALGKIKLGDKCKGEASGPQLVAALDDNGQPGLQVGWQLTVWLEHNVLLGQDPVGVTVPVPVLLPSADMITAITARLLDGARDVRQQANAQASSSGLPSMDEITKRMKGGQR